MIWLDEGGRQHGRRLVAAPPSLLDTVEHFWIHDALPKRIWRVVPDASAHLIFSIVRGQAGMGAACNVVGARSRFADIDVGDRELTIGARLRPGALPHLLRDRASLLTDRGVPLEDIAGPAGQLVIERMAQVDPHNAVQVLADFLVARMGASSPALPGHVIARSTSVSGIAHALGLSRRAVYDLVSANTGLSPKQVLRIQRLHRALWMLNTEASPVEAALRTGYCDQSHFTRDATSLLGEPPASWRKRRSIVQDAVASPGA